jgi:hypothetical protein
LFSLSLRVGEKTVMRTADGAVTVRATRITEAIRLDGRLDEQVYSAIPPIDEWFQQEPHEGSPATERTEAIDWAVVGPIENVVATRRRANDLF